MRSRPAPPPPYGHLPRKRGRIVALNLPRLRGRWRQSRRRGPTGRTLATVALLLAATPTHAADIDASPPKSLSVTIYRAPYRNGGSLDLNRLGGFALVTETRTVRLPAGENRLRFEGVVGGIQPESAIVTGLPNGVIEKNRDAAILSPSALVRAALDAEVTLVRTDAKTGKVERTPARLRSADDRGVIFETAQGIEALRCSGLPETFSFARVPAGLSSVPTLSVLTRTPHAVRATVTLSYLARGFDWAANYTATIAPGGRTLDLGAWITLANGNGETLPDARTQIVAGRLNKEYEARIADAKPQVIARCWPQGTTSDFLPPYNIAMVRPDSVLSSAGLISVTAMYRSVPPPPAKASPAPPPPPPPPEQLGDLKLYRVPQTTTIASRQSKQTRLLDQHAVPFKRIYLADLSATGRQTTPATLLLRAQNTQAGQLGVPLPAGHVAVFQLGGAREMLGGETDLRDTAESEEVELKLGPAPDVQVRQTRTAYTANAPELTRLTPGLLAAYHSGTTIESVEITNAAPTVAHVELRLQTYGTQTVTRANSPFARKDGRPIFRLDLPANAAVTIDYTVG